MPDPDPAGNIIGTLLLVAVLLLVTVLLSIADEAFTAIGDSRIRELEEDDDRKKAQRAIRIRHMTEKTRRFSGRIRMGYVVCGMLAGAAVFYRFATPLGDLLCRWFFPAETAAKAALCDGISLVLLTLATVFVLFTFGSRLPRRLALKDPEKAALALANPFGIVFGLLAPLDGLCNAVASPFIRLGGINPHEDPDQVTEDVIRDLIDAGEEMGAIEGVQKDMVNNVFEFDDITAAEIMTPRTDVTAVEVNDTIAEALQEALENGYSRLPVYEEDIDHVIGLLYVKDLLPYVGQTLPTDVSIRSLLRDTHFVPDTKKCDDLFEEMNEKHLQMSIVVDEYGGVAGIVTMEDLLESIVGSMQDEFDDEEEEVTQLDEHSFVVDGSLNIGELEELVDTTLPEGDYDTLAGFLMDQLGHIPDEEEQAVIEYDNLTFTVRRMDDRRIEQVHIHVEPKSDDEDDRNENKDDT